MPEINLPDPDGVDPDGGAWWRDSTGELVYAIAGHVHVPERIEGVVAIEWDARIRLAAIQRAQRQSEEKGATR